LRDRTDTQCILRANAFAAGDHFTAIEQGAQVDPDLLHARMRFKRDDFGIERCDLTALGFEAHGPDHISPLHQIRGVGNRQAAETGHAGRAVDQAQPVFRTELNGLQTFFGQCLLRANDLPAIAHIADTQQRNTDVGHVGQVTD